MFLFCNLNNCSGFWDTKEGGGERERWVVCRSRLVHFIKQKRKRGRFFPLRLGPSFHFRSHQLERKTLYFSLTLPLRSLLVLSFPRGTKGDILTLCRIARLSLSLSLSRSAFSPAAEEERRKEKKGIAFARRLSQRINPSKQSLVASSPSLCRYVFAFSISSCARIVSRLSPRRDEE